VRRLAHHSAFARTKVRRAPKVSIMSASTS
jgi:hypothetical protein